MGGAGAAIPACGGDGGVSVAPPTDDSDAGFEASVPDGSADGGPTCGASLVMCGSACVDTQKDPKHCGTCDHACAASEACRSGECHVVCRIGNATVAAGEADPANACARCDPARSTTDWSLDPDGTACGAGKICMNEACTPTCVIDGEVRVADAVNPANACQRCDPATSTTVWSPRPSFKLLVGGTDVTTQGWSIISVPVSDLTSDADVTQITTSTPNGARTSGQLLLSRANAYEAGKPFTIQFEVLVASVDPHNPLDSGAAILGSFSGAAGISTERRQMIYLDEAAIGWADDTQSAAVGVKNTKHVFELSVDIAQVATVSVDGVAKLTRNAFASNGTIAIGDQTNDPNVDSTMRIRSVTRICP